MDFSYNALQGQAVLGRRGASHRDRHQQAIRPRPPVAPRAPTRVFAGWWPDSSGGTAHLADDLRPAPAPRPHRAHPPHEHLHPHARGAAGRGLLHQAPRTAPAATRRQRRPSTAPIELRRHLATIDRSSAPMSTMLVSGQLLETCRDVQDPNPQEDLGASASRASSARSSPPQAPRKHDSALRRYARRHRATRPADLKVPHVSEIEILHVQRLRFSATIT